MTIREGILEIAPPWLRRFVGERLLFTFGVIFDAQLEHLRQGIKARMPGVGTPTALPIIGDDRQIDRGPTESATSFAERLTRAFDSWRVAGNPHQLLEQLQVYFSPTKPRIRLVSNSGVWHEIDGTGTITKSKPNPINWVWDAFTTRWWRGWVIVDASGTWTIDRWGDPGTWGDGGAWGSSMLTTDAQAIRNIVRKWKPANVYVPEVILVFNSSLFEASDASPPNPNGNGDDMVWRASLDANFLGSVRT